MGLCIEEVEMRCHAPRKHNATMEYVSIPGLTRTETEKEVDNRLHQEGCNANVLLMEACKRDDRDPELFRLNIPQTSNGDATARERHAMHSLRIASPHLSCGAVTLIEIHAEFRWLAVCGAAKLIAGSMIS